MSGSLDYSGFDFLLDYWYRNLDLFLLNYFLTVKCNESTKELTFKDNNNNINNCVLSPWLKNRTVLPCPLPFLQDPPRVLL